MLQVICDDNFHRGFNRIYDVSLALSLRRLFIKYSDQFRNLGGEWNTELAAKCWSIREFDDGITRVCFGWPSVDAYYEGQQNFNHLLFLLHGLFSNKSRTALCRVVFPIASCLSCVYQARWHITKIFIVDMHDQVSCISSF